MTAQHLTRRLLPPAAFLLAAAGVLLSATTRPAASQPAGPHRAHWLHQARWGAMIHMNGARKPGQWDKVIDAFDVKTLAQQLHDVHAGYCMIASIQADYPIAPNAAYERRLPGQCPKRDLILDLAAELDRHQIPLMLYYNTNIKWEPTDEGVAFRAAVLREYAVRYGRKVRGWWFDNSFGQATPAQNRGWQGQMAQAALAGNPDAILGFSPPHGAQRNTPFDDYTAGNLHNLMKVTCPSRFVDGCQWHTLCYLGTTWGSQKPRYKGSEAADITRRLVASGGVVTWDVPHDDSGRLVPAVIPQLRAISEALGGT